MRHEVFEVADRLRARGVGVSLHNVIRELRYGGSKCAVGPHLPDWKAERTYLSRAEAA